MSWMFQLTQEYLQVCSCKSEQSWMDDLGIFFRPRATLAYRPAANSRAVGKMTEYCIGKWKPCR